MLGLAACTGPGQTVVIPLVPTATPTLTPTATMTPTPTVTPTPTPTSTPNPAPLAVSAAEGEASVRSHLNDGSSLLCLRHEDTDGDGTPEWIALAHREAPSGWLSAFILDGTQFYQLQPAQPEAGKPSYGFGEFATCEMEVRDVNADGRVEVAIFGHTQSNKTMMQLFVWDGADYRRLGDFTGDSWIRFERRDGQLADSILVGYREPAAPDFAWSVIYTWDGQTYGWTTDRYDWYYLDRPHTYSSHKAVYAVVSFYMALNDRDLPGAYALLAPDTQSVTPYESWSNGFNTTLKVEIGSAHDIPDGGDDTHAKVAAMVTSWDNEGSHVMGRLWNVEWSLVLTGDGWRLVEAKTTLLDEWESVYWR